MRTFYITPDFLKGLTKTLLTLLLLFSIIPTTQGQTGNRTTKCDVRQATVNYDGFVYEIWQSKDNTDGCMVVKNNGDFYASWSKIENTLVRKSKRPGSTKQVIDYYIDQKISGNSFYSSYGWWEDTSQSNEYKRIVEYYVVEGYGVHKPVDGLSYKGKYTISGEGTYELWIGANRYDPTVYGSGNKKFTQIKSVRTSKRSSGKISMATHFDKWAGEGFSVGDLFEVSMKVEGYSEGPKDPTSGGAYVRADFSTSGSSGSGGSGSSGGGNTSGTVADGVYNIQNIKFNEYMQSYGSTINMTTTNPSRTSRKWKIKNVGNGYVNIDSEASGRGVIETQTNSTSIKLTTAQATQTQNKRLFKLVPADNGTFRIESKQYPGQYVNKYGTSIQRNTGTGPSSKWKFISFGAKATLSDTSNASEEISIYPNPTNGEFNIDLGTAENATVLVYNITGQRIIEQTATRNIAINADGLLMSGIYIIQVIGQDAAIISTKKIIIN